MEPIDTYLTNTIQILGILRVRERRDIDSLVRELVQLRERHGRLFIIGLGGNAAHAMHAAADFRNLCCIEAYSFDNFAELTAGINDAGWDRLFVRWLKANRCSATDMLLVLSVGGGSERPDVSVPIVEAIVYAQRMGMRMGGIVGRDGGYTKRNVDVCVVVPVVDPATVTPQTEGVQSVLLHLLVSHPDLQRQQAKWESLDHVQS